jgi:peptide chain release factor
MSRFGVSQEKERALEARLRALQIHEEDLEESFIRSSGPGGQHVNKTSTCVRLLHRPTGLSVKVQHSRSQGLNRFLARRLLADRVEQQLRGEESPQAQQRDKTRRQKQRRARRTKRKRQELAGEESSGASLGRREEGITG